MKQYAVSYAGEREQEIIRSLTCSQRLFEQLICCTLLLRDPIKYIKKNINKEGHSPIYNPLPQAKGSHWSVTDENFCWFSTDSLFFLITD